MVTGRCSAAASLDPLERIVKLLVESLNVLHHYLLTQHLLIERQREAVVDELAVVQCLQNDMHISKLTYTRVHIVHTYTLYCITPSHIN